MKFIKGMSGNPDGLSKELRKRIAAVRDAALEAAPEAVARLRELVKSTDGKVAIGASLAILERACGKPAAGAPPDDRMAKLAEQELKTRAELQRARAKELELSAEVEQLRAQVAELAARAVN